MPLSRAHRRFLGSGGLRPLLGGLGAHYGMARYRTPLQWGSCRLMAAQACCGPIQAGRQALTLIGGRPFLPPMRGLSHWGIARYRTPLQWGSCRLLAAKPWQTPPTTG